MMDILEPNSLSYTIHDFKRQAHQLIEEIVEREHIPIIVGGTNYYMDSLLWHSLIPTHEKAEESSR